MSTLSKLQHWVITGITAIALTIGTNLVTDMTQAPSDNKVQDYQIQTLNENFAEFNKNMTEALNKINAVHDETIRAQGRDQVLNSRMDSMDKNLGLLNKRVEHTEEWQRDTNEWKSNTEKRLGRLEGGKSSS